jgi:hypothetical protein
MDTFEGFPGDPHSLHKYTYVNNSPVRLLDPSGNQETMEELDLEMSVELTEDAIPLTQPAVAGVAQTAAQTVVVTSQLQVAISNLLLNSLIVAPLVAAVLPTDTPKKDDDKKQPTDNRGRLQVQGGDIENQKYDLSAHQGFKYDADTLSWPWSQATPLLALTAHTKLSEFLQILTYEQIGRRGKAFADASRFIENASLGGGTGPTRVTFNARDPKYPNARVDIEVQSGRAFTLF